MFSGNNCWILGPRINDIYGTIKSNENAKNGDDYPKYSFDTTFGLKS